MKKFRPYTKFPDDIVGKQVRTKRTGNITTVVTLDTKKNRILLPAPTCDYSVNDMFDEFTFLDGTPVGEEYEEVVELEHDKVYLVRYASSDFWIARHFCKRYYFDVLFYDNGRSSKTAKSPSCVSAWGQVCEYSETLVDKTTEPTEYLIKQN